MDNALNELIDPTTEDLQKLIVYIEDGIQLAEGNSDAKVIDSVQELKTLKEKIQIQLKELLKQQQNQHTNQEEQVKEQELKEEEEEESKKEKTSKQMHEISRHEEKQDGPIDHKEEINQLEMESSLSEPILRNRLESKSLGVRSSSFHSRRIKSHLRKELLRDPHKKEGEDDETNVTYDMDEDSKKRELMQEELTSEVRDLAGALKKRALEIHNVLKEDNATVEDAARLFDQNVSKVKSETLQLTKHNQNILSNVLKTSVMTMFVAVVFFIMMGIILIFPKR